MKRTTPPFVLPAVLPSAMLPGMLWLSGADVISVPLEIHAHRPFVQVVLNGHPANFLFDTSVQQTSVDADALADTDRDAAQALQIGAIRLHVPAVRNGIGDYTKTYLGTAAAGVLGADILARFPVALDGKSGSLRIFRNNVAEAAARPLSAMLVPLTTAGGFPVVAVTMDDIPAGMYALDTGAGSDFEMRMSSATSHHVSLVGAVPEVREARSGASVAGHTMRLASAQLGAMMRIAGPIVALPDERQHWFPPGVDGMLGGRLLERIDLWIDLPAHTLAMVARDDTEMTISTYDTSGAWLIAKKNGVYVHAIVPGSPADIGGLGVGDELLKINTEFVVGLERARELLVQPTGTRVQVMYRRGTVLHTTTLVLRDPL